MRRDADEYRKGRSFCGKEDDLYPLNVCLISRSCRLPHQQMPREYWPARAYSRDWRPALPEVPKPVCHNTLCRLTDFAVIAFDEEPDWRPDRYAEWVYWWMKPISAPFTKNTVIPEVTDEYVTRYAERFRKPQHNGIPLDDLLHAARNIVVSDIRVHTGASRPYEYAWQMIGVAGALGYCYSAYPYYAMQEAAPLVAYLCEAGYDRYCENLIELLYLHGLPDHPNPNPYKPDYDIYVARLDAWNDYLEELAGVLLLAAQRASRRTHRGGYAKQWPSTLGHDTKLSVAYAS